MKKELQEILRSGQFRIAGLIVLLLTVIAVVISAGYYQSVQQQHATSRRHTVSLITIPT